MAIASARNGVGRTASWPGYIRAAGGRDTDTRKAGAHAVPPTAPSPHSNLTFGLDVFATVVVDRVVVYTIRCLAARAGVKT